MSTATDETIDRLGRSIIVAKVLKPLLEASLFFVWLIYLVGVITNQDYNGNLAFDLFLARVGGPTASHATTYLIFLSIFPIAYFMLRSIIPAFLVEVLAFDIHEGMWQIAYYIAWHSVIDWRVWITENGPDTLTAAIVIAALVLIYHFPTRFFAVVAAAWGIFLSAWLAIGFPVSVLSKLPGYQVIPSVYNTTLWVNQIEFLSWLFFASVLLVCLKYFAPKRSSSRLPDLPAESSTQETLGSASVPSEDSPSSDSRSNVTASSPSPAWGDARIPLAPYAWLSISPYRGLHKDRFHVGQ